MDSEQGHRTALRGPSVRASVERGDPLSIYRRKVCPHFELRPGCECRHCRGVCFCTVRAPFPAGSIDRTLHAAPVAAVTLRPEPDSSQPVAADPEPLDAETDGDYSHGVEHAQIVDELSEGHKPCSTSTTPLAESVRIGHVVGAATYTDWSREAADHRHSASRHRGREDRREVATLADGGSNPSGVFDRLAFLARAQRIDPRERKP